MDLREAFGGKFSATEGKRKDRTRIKNLEPETRPDHPSPVPETSTHASPQGTSLRPSDVNPRPSSVHRGPVSNFPTLGQVLGNAARSTLGTIGSLGSSLGNAGDPGIYLIQLQIARDDCHMICVFLLVFILSFLLSNRKSA